MRCTLTLAPSVHLELAQLPAPQWLALDFFAQLYHIESQVKDADDAERLRTRQEQSRPILAELKAWLDATLPVVTPKSKLGQALSYLHSVWPKLIRYTERGDLPIDNNA